MKTRAKVVGSTIMHEADHSAALWCLLGPDSIRHVTVVPDKLGCSGLVKLGELPPERSLALNAADLAVCLVLPLLDTRLLVDSSTDADWNKAEECAARAYAYRPDRSADADDFKRTWLTAVMERAAELADSAYFRRVRAALELELRGSYYLGAERIRMVLAEVA